MIVHRASEYGRCIRASVADRLGYRALPAPDVLEAAYARGNEHEEVCIEKMRADGWEIAHQLDGFVTDEGQVFIKLEVGSDVILTGHLDGVAIQVWGTDEHGGESRYVLEVKAPNAYDSFERAVRTDTYDALATRYAWQVSAYMVATSLECVVASWDEARGIRTFVIEEPIFSRERIVARVQAIEEIVASYQQAGKEIRLGPEWCATAEFDAWSCPFRHRHEQGADEDDPALDGMVDQYEHASSSMKYAESVKRKLQSQIDEYLGDRDGITTARARVTRYTQTTETPDRDALKRDGLWTDTYVKTTTSERLRVTLRKDVDVPAE